MTTIEFNKRCTCGPEFVAVRIIDNHEELKIGNIWLPQMSEANSRLANAVVENVGKTAAEEYGIKEGDHVVIDRLSTFAHTAPVACLKYNNVIMKADETFSEFYPLKNMLFVEPDSTDEITDVGGVLVRNYADKLNTGTITKMNCDGLDLPFNIGDKVLVTKGADNVQVGEKTIRIYKHDMIIAKIED